MLTNGFSNLKSSSEPFLDTTESSSIRTACQLACDNKDKITFCCKEYEIDKEKIKCTDSRLEIQCNLNCKEYSCGKR